jgi:hypothetical protein
MTDNEQLCRHFARMGARLKFETITSRWGQRRRTMALDIREDRHGEYFALHEDEKEQVGLQVLDVQPGQRHLLLMTRRPDRKEKFLCGHDERHWFVAAVPGRWVSNVKTAMDALKPALVRARESNLAVPNKLKNRRRNEAFIRQGEWFFVPALQIDIPETLVLSNEPIRRGRGKPHMVDQLARLNGDTVYVCPKFPNGLRFHEYRKVLEQNPKAHYWRWALMRRDAEVYARGRVRHADHKTIILNGWHRVQMNRETDAPAMRHVVFLD